MTECRYWLQDFICPPREEIFSVYLGHARAHDQVLGEAGNEVWLGVTER